MHLPGIVDDPVPALSIHKPFQRCDELLADRIGFPASPFPAFIALTELRLAQLPPPISCDLLGDRLDDLDFELFIMRA